MRDASLSDSADNRPALSGFDLTSCDSEPITRLERIQSFGFLIAMTRDWVVCRVSSNLEILLGVRPCDALGATMDSLVDLDALHEIRNRILGLRKMGGVERLYNVALVQGRPAVDLAIHYVDGLCVLEGEPAGLDNRVDAASLVRKMVARLNTQPSLEAFHADAARQIRALTGFDRVMIYRFLADGAGEVIAEVCQPGAESFLGLRYPASDIPVQARALYLRNPFRIIADVGAQTVPLLAPGDTPAEPLDLTLSVTRAVSAVHVEYLRNMGVGASLSISIIVEGRLWGLVACHHDKPRLPSFVTRSAAELFGQMYSMTLESRLRLAADDQDRYERQLVARMVKSIASNESLLSNAGWLQDILREMIQCDGIVVTIDGIVSASGMTPTGVSLDAITQFVNALSTNEIFVSDHLSALCPEVPQAPETAAGVLSIPISRYPGNYIMLFRREQLRDIQWAGRLDKAVPANGDSGRLSPRKSFAAFSESVRGQSRPYTESEQRVAESIRSGLIEAIFRGNHAPHVEQNHAIGRQELLIAELNHRVRNVLALIRGLISQTRGEGGDSASYVESLNGRVQALARAHDRVTRDNWGPGLLNAIFDDEISAYVPTRRDRFTIRGPLVFLQPQAFSTLALIIHELVTNASKYGALCDDSGRVDVTLSMEPEEGLRLRWQETGGPPVQTPTRRGFGSVIIERVVPYDLQGTATVAYLPAGFEAEFLIPQLHVAPAGTSGSEIATTATTATTPESLKAVEYPLENLNVLLLEDNLIVALEAEDLLRALGAASVIAVSSPEAALKACVGGPIQFAVLDINLGVGNSLGFAAYLRDARIPFVFASGYGDEKAASESRTAELLVSKPYDRDSLQAAIATALARAPAGKVSYTPPSPEVTGFSHSLERLLT